MKPKNIFLAASLAAFAVGFSDGGESTFWYMGRPVGAVLFVLFMIFMFLEKETMLLDEQNRAAMAQLNKSFRPNISGCNSRLERNADPGYGSVVQTKGAVS